MTERNEATDPFAGRTFGLTIYLGNAAMLTGEDVADALREVAECVESLSELTEPYNGTIRDLNGNAVGRWAVGA